MKQCPPCHKDCNEGRSCPVRYGILDDEGKVVRWVWTMPPYPHIVEKIKRLRKPKTDTSKVPDAPF